MLTCGELGPDVHALQTTELQLLAEAVEMAHSKKHFSSSSSRHLSRQGMTLKYTKYVDSSEAASSIATIMARNQGQEGGAAGRG